MTSDSWPALPLSEWEGTKTSLHLYCQIVGKIRLALTPRLNHWWNVTLYVSSRGITTGRTDVRLITATNRDLRK